MKAMGLDARIGAAFLQAGLGYGGSCFPKDTDALVHTAATLGYRFDILRAAVDVNAGRAGHFVDMIERALAPLNTRRIAILGLAFKPNTDDMREAKSIEVISRLVDLGATVCAYDPVAMMNARKTLPTVRRVRRLAVRGGDGRRRGRAHHGVERVQVPEPGAAADRDAAPDRLRRTEPLGS